MLSSFKALDRGNYLLSGEFDTVTELLFCILVFDSCSIQTPGPVFVSHWAYMLDPCAWRCSIGSSLKVRTVEPVVVSTIDNQVCVKHYDTNKRFTL